MSRPSPLKAAAAAKGLTLKAVAEATGYTEGTIGQVSRGNAAPWPELRRRLTELFGFDPFGRNAGGPATTFTADHPAVRRLVESAIAQGFPAEVTDPTTLAKVAAILTTRKAS